MVGIRTMPYWLHHPPDPLHLRQIRSLQARTLAALRRAEAGNDLRAMLAGIREPRATFELPARLSAPAEHPQPPADLTTSEEWIAVRGAIVKALDGHPEARDAAVTALQAFD